MDDQRREEIGPNDGIGDAPDEGDSADIQELLDLGYDQLDGFVVWAEEVLRVGTRIAQQDCFNAELLIDYLANHQRKGISSIDEFDLRWFMFSHYIRKAQADPETEQRLPDSLERFFQFLRTEQAGLTPSWLQSVLDDSSFYQQRRLAYHELDQLDEQEWEERFQEWCRELEDDLDLRSLWLPRDLGDNLRWSAVMGWREATLQTEANRDWQQERERLLSDGLDFDNVRELLTIQFQVWLDTPQQRLEDLTPREVILAERADRIPIDEELN